jgi:RHS repeat-associated core domain
MMQPGRSWNIGNYRYGFNGKENDNEIKGEGNQQDYGMRVYDPRLGKFLSVDPLTNNYPFYAPYQFASNNPIVAIDVDGLESSKILNKAESLLYTPYEFGGKSPPASLIGSINTTEGNSFWENELKPVLQKISDDHPMHYKAKHPQSMLTSSEISDNWRNTVKDAYSDFQQVMDGAKSIGIDCSGFVYASYIMDKELSFISKSLNTGSGGQLGVFKTNTGWGTTYYHKNFNLVSEGDLIHNEGHVMIATGYVRLDDKGNVSEFQTYEANSTDKGSLVMWRKVEGKYMIGHPFRTTDLVGKPLDIGIVKILPRQSYGQQRSFNFSALERIKANLKQTVEESPKTTKKQ